MTPARRPEKVADGILQGAGTPGIAEQFAPGLESDDEGIERADIAGKTILGPFFFLLKSPEKLVPYNEDPRMVLIQVFQIGAMMHPVMGRRIENKFHRTGKSP